MPAAGWRAVVGGVKARALENDPNRLVHLAQRLLRALRAARQRWIAEFLLSVKLYTAIFASVSVYWHKNPSAKS